MLSIWLTASKPHKPPAPFKSCVRIVFNEAIPSSRRTYQGSSIADSTASAVGMTELSYCSWTRAGGFSHIPPGKAEKTSYKGKNNNWNEHAGSRVLAMHSWTQLECSAFPWLQLAVVWWGKLFRKTCPLPFRFCLQQPRALILLACSSVLSLVLDFESCFFLFV